MEYNVKKMLGRVLITVMAICSAVALFVDVKSTGNLSMALNGDGVPQLMALVLLIWAYYKVYIEKRILSGVDKRAKIGYGVLAVMFAIFMVIGKAQSAHADLKYQYLAIVLLAGYIPLFYMILLFLGLRIDCFLKSPYEFKPGKISNWIFEKHVFIGVMLIVFAFRLPYLIAFYPYSMTWDGGVQICSVMGKEAFTSHHPPLVSFFYGFIAIYSQKWNIPNVGMFMIPVLQTTLSAYAAAKTCELFKNMKVPYWVRWTSLIYYAAFTVWCIYDVTVIKDTLYYPMTMLFVIQIIYCLMDSEVFGANKRNLVLLFLYGVLVTQIRNNGIYVLIFVLPIVFLVVRKKFKAVVGVTAVLMFALVYILNNIVYPALGVTNIVVKEDKYCIMFQQTAKYGQDYPDDVTDEEREILEEIFDYDELVEVYNPQLADWVKNCLKISEASSADGTNSEFLAVKDKYFKVWFAQFKRHPLSYIKTFFACSYGYYYPEVKPYKEGTGCYENDRIIFHEGLHASRQIEVFAPARFILEQISKLAYVPGIGLLYRCGIYAWMVLFAVMYFIVKKRYINIVAAIPAMVNILVCLISPVNTCLRYAFPTMCMVPILLGLIFVMKKDER